MSKRDDEIRNIVLNEHSDIKRLMLTPHKIAIVKSLGKEGKTSIEISKKFDKRLEASSCVLFDMFKQGYLTRDNVGDPSGGSLYIYKSRF